MFRALIASVLGWASAQQLKAELVGNQAPVSVPTLEDNFVFLQKFPLQGVVELFYHTEIVVCPRDGFTSAAQQYLDGQISQMKDFAEIPESWWHGKTTPCYEIGYGGDMCTEECCSVGHRAMGLGDRHAVIANADVNKKSLFVYGHSNIDGEQAFHDTCDHKCWSLWRGIDYNVFTTNCNTFTSTVLSCVYGLSQKKPDLGISDMVTVHGHCPAAEEHVIIS